MKLIAGLGNPGSKYKKTRHNTGFLFLDFLKDRLGISSDFKINQRFKAEVLEIDLSGEKIILLKPQTFMNLSGEAILKAMSFYKIPKENIMVVFDDASLELGKVRFRNSGSSGGQNGVKSIIANIGQDFKRIKIGIGWDKNIDLSSWVLSNFSDEELEKLNKDIFPRAYELLIKNL